MKWFSKVIYDAYPEGQDFPIYGGSTNDLKRRQKEHRKSHPDWFGKGTLKEVRKVEGWFETEDSFDAYVAVCEQKHIVAERGYDIGLGTNQVLPVDDYLNGFCPTHEMSSKGGRIGGRIGGHSQPREAKAKGGRIGGRIGGRKNVESGHLARITTPESCAKGGRIGGLITGRKNVESGHLARIRTPESQAKGGRAAVESGQLARIRTKGSCARWRIQRGKPCVCGRHELPKVA